ncbi:hypothetical protein [Sphingomicrobium clamense]|uniref:CHRD domain-containing protein n=1 Tax=Sphingomicrobium clamense TaxID=2851013 RepID=A0ABS6V8G6_9SPHN|nr:hypothetical protein [Sphingomicrobium sp. B8]MBW0145328.1 hypothetical protein [Sphingomicrobium sp. B8]
MIKQTNPLALALVGAVMVGAPAPAQDTRQNDSYTADLQTLNESGVTGTVTLSPRGRYLDVTYDVMGLEEDQPHAAHIHGLGVKDAACPTASQDTDEDGFLELLEGAAVYGGIIITLGGGDNDIDDDGDGMVSGTVTLDLSAKGNAFTGDATRGDLQPLGRTEIVIHGLTLEENDGTLPGEADGTAGYKAFLPVACGSFERDNDDSLEFRTP